MKYRSWQDCRDEQNYMDFLESKMPKGIKVIPFLVRKKTIKRYKKIIRLDNQLFKSKASGAKDRFFLVADTCEVALENSRKGKKSYFVREWKKFGSYDDLQIFFAPTKKHAKELR